jgi:hypothetical protein
MRQYSLRMVRVIWNKQNFYMSSYWLENLKNYTKGVMEKNTSAVILFDGRSGLGKTTLSSQTGCALHNEIRNYMGKKTPPFTLENIYYTPDNFVERLKVAKKGEIIILDEAMILSNRSAMSDMNKKVIIIMSLIRSKQIFVIFNLNSIFDMDKNLPLHRADALVHLYAEDDRFAARGRYMVIPAWRGRLKMLYILGKKYYDYSKGKSAFVDRFDGFFPFNEKEYEKRKQKAIEDYFENAAKPASSKIKKSRDQAVRNVKRIYSPPSTELAEIFDVSRRTIYSILKPKGGEP